MQRGAARLPLPRLRVLHAHLAHSVNTTTGWDSNLIMQCPTVRLGGESSNRLFETFDEWNSMLQADL